MTARVAQKEKQCEQCTERFVVDRRRKYCSPECREDGSLQRARERYRIKRPEVMRVFHRRGKPEFGQELSQSEIDRIIWIAKGKSDEMICEIMGISQKTAMCLLADAKVKLGANSRGHAVALLLIREGYAKAF